MEQAFAENKMRTMPVRRLLLTMAAPMMVSMLVQALYNVVDSIFVSHISQDALTAVSLAFSLQNFMIAVAVGTGVGVNALLSKTLGEGDKETTDLIAGNAVTLSLCTYLVFAVAGIFVIKPFFLTQTGDALIIKYGMDYLSVIVGCSFGMFLQICTERLLTSTGKTFYSMIVQIIGAVINIVLDPIMIFGLLGCPALGVRGAALATVIGQIIGCVAGVVINIRVNREITFSAVNLRLRKRIVKRIYAVAIPTIIMQSVMSVMIFGFNKILAAFSNTAIAVFGVYIKLQSFIFMPVFGINNGLVPIVSYNYGARSRERIVQTIKFGITLAVLIMTGGFILFEAAPELLFSVFKSGDLIKDEAMMRIGVKALRIIAVHFPVAGICILVSSVFQALSLPLYSLFVALGRQLGVLLPAAWLLSLTGVLDYVWLAFPIAELSSLLLSLFFLRKALRLIDFDSKPEAAPEFKDID